MIINCLWFMLLGIIFGVLFDIDTTLVNAVNNHIIKFMLDFFTMCNFGILFFILLLALNDGMLRGLYVLSTFLGFVIYMKTLFKMLKSLRNKITKSLRRIFEKFKIKQLKLNYFKKVLHYTK